MLSSWFFTLLIDFWRCYYAILSLCIESWDFFKFYINLMKSDFYKFYIDLINKNSVCKMTIQQLLFWTSFSYSTFFSSIFEDAIMWYYFFMLKAEISSNFTSIWWNLTFMNFYIDLINKNMIARWLLNSWIHEWFIWQVLETETVDFQLQKFMIWHWKYEIIWILTMMKNIFFRLAMKAFSTPGCKYRIKCIYVSCL